VGFFVLKTSFKFMRSSNLKIKCSFVKVHT